jgi:hypothetical protein
VQKLVKDEHPDLWQRAVDTGNQKRQRGEELKATSLAQQQADDAALLGGQLAPRQWQQQKSDRQTAKTAALAEVYRDSGGQVFANDPVLAGYFKAIDQSKQANNGAVDWGAVDAWKSQLSDAQLAHIDQNVGLDKTPLEKLRASLSNQYYDLPQYRGYSSDEARTIDQVMQAVDSRAGANASEATKSRILRSLPGYSSLDPKVVQGATRQIWGVLAKTPDRAQFLKAHPAAVALIQRQGTLTAADVAAVRNALGQPA